MTSIAPINNVRRGRTVVGGAGAVAGGPTGPAARTATSFVGAPRKSGGMSVRERFETLEERFKPDAAKGVNVRFQFKLSGSGGGDWYVEIKNGKISVTKGTGPNPTATLKASAEDYKKIAEGDMNKTWAFLRGKLKIDGDKDALSKFDSYFRKP